MNWHPGLTVTPWTEEEARRWREVAMRPREEDLFHKRVTLTPFPEMREWIERHSRAA